MTSERSNPGFRMPHRHVPQVRQPVNQTFAVTGDTRTTMTVGTI
jgi:hypothetical protein